ncbi:hypothetical protein WJX72_008264 [[Myrmecia] bisecta]|uniref:Glutathione reductase n=1 Tax=[Myrmecia] bisecta TaxID=41462 RepID=A0AAW1QRG3_9CHLO
MSFALTRLPQTSAATGRSSTVFRATSRLPGTPSWSTGLLGFAAGLGQMPSSVSRSALQARAESSNGASSSQNGSAPDYDYDLFTIGAGSGGVRASKASADLGAKVGICELPLGRIATDTIGGVGGTCILRGCVPKKLLSYGSEFALEYRHGHNFGWEQSAPPALNWERLMANKNKELDRLNGVYRKMLRDAGIDFFEGRGQIIDQHTVEVNGKRFKVKNICIATGGKPITPPIEGAEHAIISDQILDLPKLPKKLAVVGGGYISCEQATIYNAFGSEVHVFNRTPSILGKFDKECTSFIAEQYKLAGVKIYTSCSPEKLAKQPDGRITIEAKYEDGKQISVEDFDYVLMATGRKPNTKGIGLEKVGVELDDKGGVKVDEYSRSVSVPNVFAIGDVTNRIPLTPVARMEGSLLGAHLFGDEPDEAKPDYEGVPSVVFSTPQMATVGLSEEDAIEKFKDVDVYTSTFRPMKNSMADEELKALTKLVVDAKTDKVLGIHMVGPEAAEIMQGLAAALKVGITKKQLDGTVGIHPTSAEEFVTMRKPARRIRNKEKVKAAA